MTDGARYGGTYEDGVGGSEHAADAVADRDLGPG